MSEWRTARDGSRAGYFRGALIAVGISLFLALFVSGSPAAAQTSVLQPRADCSWLLPDGSWLTVWRYLNTGVAQNIPVRTTPSPYNYFTGTGATVATNQGQFTSFLASQTPQSAQFFVVHVPSTVTTLTWFLAGANVHLHKPGTVGSAGRNCASSPVPLIAGGDTLSSSAAMAATMTVTTFVLLRRRNRAGSAPVTLPARGT
jgi:hypothetical protein